jgi:aryl-alcohol dehydrogenase-like predicted oxidoreductase
LGNSGLEISRIGFGAWAAGGGDWAFSLGPQDDAVSIAAIRTAVENGINWIDTAPLYGLGHSEEVVKRALDGLADRPYIFTKCGMPWDANGRITHDLRRDSIRRECEASLRRFGVDAIDLYQIHWNIPSEQVEEAIAKLKEEGKVLHTGVSNFDVDQLDLALELAEIQALQPPHSLIDRSIEAEVPPYCGRHNIGVISYSPMQSGLLSGKMNRSRIETLPADDLRRRKLEFQEPRLSHNLAIAETLQSIGDQEGRSAAGVAVAWVLANKFVNATIVGMRSPEQVEGIFAAADFDLTPQHLESLSQDRNFEEIL